MPGLKRYFTGRRRSVLLSCVTRTRWRSAICTAAVVRVTLGRPTPSTRVLPSSARGEPANGRAKTSWREPLVFFSQMDGPPGRHSIKSRGLSWLRTWVFWMPRPTAASFFSGREDAASEKQLHGPFLPIPRGAEERAESGDPPLPRLDRPDYAAPFQSTWPQSPEDEVHQRRERISRWPHWKPDSRPVRGHVRYGTYYVQWLYHLRPPGAACRVPFDVIFRFLHT